MQGTQEGTVSAENIGVATDSFTERMRERMPAHATWRRSTTAPALSRPANDAMWDEMRARLRTYQIEKSARTETLWRQAWELLIQPAGPRTVIAIVTGGLLLLAALAGLVR